MPPNNHKKGLFLCESGPFLWLFGGPYLAALPKRKVKSMYAGRM